MQERLGYKISGRLRSAYLQVNSDILPATELLWCNGATGLIEFQAEVQIVTLISYQVPDAVPLPCLLNRILTKSRSLCTADAKGQV